MPKATDIRPPFTESRDRDGQWWRSHGNEMWEFDPSGLMRRRYASINDVAIADAERRLSG